MTTHLLVSLRENISILTLASADGYPRLAHGVLERLEDQMVRLLADPTIRGAVIAGGEQAFAAGAEIREIAALQAAGGFEFSRFGQKVLAVIARSRKPVIAAIRGFCIGGALDLVLACRQRVATADAVFAHPGGAIGIMTGWGGTQRLARLIGRARALEMFTTGARITAHQAFECGLVQEMAQETDLIQVAAERAKALLALTLSRETERRIHLT